MSTGIRQASISRQLGGMHTVSPKSIVVGLIFVTIFLQLPANAIPEDEWAASSPNRHITPEELWTSKEIEDRGPLLEIAITAVGDVTIGADPRRGVKRGSQKHYAKLFHEADGDVLKNASPFFLRDNEITLINLESSFTTSKRLRKASKSYTFRADPQYAAVLYEAGVDVVGHANNHSADYVGGASQTKKAIRDNHMAYAAGKHTAVIERNGVKVGFFAYNVAGRFANRNIKAGLKKLSKQCDVVVASFHWGKEYEYAVSAKQRRIARMAIKNGADLVVGHGSHVVSGVESYRGRYIFYSLGTFSSAIKTPKDMDTVLIYVNFLLDPVTKTIEECVPELVPFSMSSNPDANDACPIPLEGDEQTRVLTKMKRYSQGKDFPFG